MTKPSYPCQAAATHMEFTVPKPTLVAQDVCILDHTDAPGENYCTGSSNLQGDLLDVLRLGLIGLQRWQIGQIIPDVQTALSLFWGWPFLVSFRLFLCFAFGWHLEA